MKFSRYVALCILTSILLFFTSCSTQNTIVPPSPGTWKIVHSVNPGSAKNALNAVAATSVNDAWAVGAFSNSQFNVPGGKALIEHWNGSKWSVVNSPAAPLDGNILTGVTAISPTNAWAVGNAFSNNNFNSNNSKEQTLIEYWNGASWVIVKSPDPANEAQLFAITALSATDIWVVGGYGNHLERTYIEHWNGMAWRVVQSPNPGSIVNYLTGLAAISTNDIWAIGASFNAIPSSEMQGTLIEHWNGISWTVVPNPNPGTNGNTLSAIAAVSTNDVWAVGYTNNGSPVTDTLIEHWNGKSWTTVEGQNPGKESNNLSAVVALSPHNVWTVGSFNSAFSNQQAQPLIEHWNGASWGTVASPNIGTPHTVLAGTGLVPHTTNIWAVGSGATYGAPVKVPSPDATGTSYETPVTVQTLIESCCS